MLIENQQHNTTKTHWFKATHRNLLCSTLLLSLSACHGSNRNNDQPIVDGVPDQLPVEIVYEKATYSSPIALSNDNLLVWSVNPDSDSISVVRTDTQVLLTKIAVGHEPRSITLSPDNQFAYVANAADNNVSVIQITNAAADDFSASLVDAAGTNGFITTGSEPNAVLYSPDGKRVFVTNSNQDTVTVIDGSSHAIIGSVDMKNSLCNVGDTRRHFHPRAMAVTQDNKQLYVTRFLSYTTETGVQKDDHGKEGVVCRLDIDTASTAMTAYQPVSVIQMAATDTGMLDAKDHMTAAFPNQLQSIVLRDGHAYLPNIAASPSGPQRFDVNTQAYINRIDGIGATESDAGSINLHLGGRQPEEGKQELYFANPWGMAFTNQTGAASAYVITAGSDMLVKLNVDEQGVLGFTVDQDTTRYIDLNDPDNPATKGANAGKNPLGIVINDAGTIAYVTNYISRNLSIIDLTTDTVVKVVATDDLPVPGSQEEINLVGAEVFYSSRGNFVRPEGANGANRNRLGDKARQGCASCHPRGLTDGIIWQFASGPRKTLSVNGTFNPQDFSDQKIINASAVFDEVEDADLNTRRVSSSGRLPFPISCDELPPLTGITKGQNNREHGLILGREGDFEFAPCILNQFAKPNANRPQPEVQLPGSEVSIRAHDALVDYQRRALRTPNRAMTTDELTAANSPTLGGIDATDIEAGKTLFVAANCQSCHHGGKWTKSHKDFVSPPDPSEVFSEVGAKGANQLQFLPRFLNDIGSYQLNVVGKDNMIAGFPAIGGEEIDSDGNKALGIDHNGDGKGNGFNAATILGAFSSPPYYHNGACETVACVLADTKHRTAGLAADQADPLVEEAEQAKVAIYVESIDESSAVH
jgi:YVTN family beta-propeller protein